MTASRSARLWFAADATVRRLRPRSARTAVRVLMSGICLGRGGEGFFVEVDELCYASERYAYHDSDAHNLRGLFDWEAEAIAAHFPPRARLLLTAAGGGREAFALSELGYDVVACESHPLLRARAHGLAARTGRPLDLRPAARDHALVGAGPFDGAVVGWGSYTFIRGTQRRRRFLSELAGSLRPGAPILLSFFARRREARRFRWIRSIAQAMGQADVEIGDVVDPNWQHYVGHDELREELEAAGMRLEVWRTDPYGHAIARRR